MIREGPSVDESGRALRAQGSAWVRVAAWALFAALLAIYLFAPLWMLVILPAAYWGYVRFLYPFARARPKGYLVGMAQLGTGVAWGLTLVFVCLSISASPRIEQPSLAQVVLIALFATCEEVLWRGIVLAEVELHLGSRWALIASSAAFALWHPGLGPSLLGHLAEGCAYGAAYLASRRLWFSIGMHAAVNSMLFLAEDRRGTVLAYVVLQSLTTAVILGVARTKRRLAKGSSLRVALRRTTGAQGNPFDRGRA